MSYKEISDLRDLEDRIQWMRDKADNFDCIEDFEPGGLAWQLTGTLRGSFDGANMQIRARLEELKSSVCEGCYVNATRPSWLFSRMECTGDGGCS